MQRTLKLDLILGNKGLALVVDLGGELGRDGVVSGRVLDNKSLVTVDTLIRDRLLNSPLANICPFLLFLVRASRVLLGSGWLPPLVPTVGELLEEIGLESGGLIKYKVSDQWRHNRRAEETGKEAARLPAGGWSG
jgi:hypothetical protein